MLIQVASVVSPFAVVTLNEISALHDCNGSEIRTYLALALHAGPDGDCWPGRRRLAEVTGQTKANVSRSTAALATCGLIEKELTPTGRVIYHLPLHRRPAALVPVPERAPPGIELDTPPVSDPTPIEQTTINQETEREPDPVLPADPVAAPLSQDVLRQAKTTAPDGMPESWIEVGQTLRPDLPVAVIRQSAEVFLDHHRSQGTVLTDWLPAWRNWLRRERAPQGPPFARKPLAPPTALSPYGSAHYGAVAQETAQEAAAKFAAQMARYGAVPSEGGTWARPVAAAASVPVPATPARSLKPTLKLMTPPKLDAAILAAIQTGATLAEVKALRALTAAGGSLREVTVAESGVDATGPGDGRRAPC